MRAITLLILTLFISGIAFSQNNIASIVKQSEILVPEYEMAAAGGKVLYLPMEYGGKVFLYTQKDAFEILQDAIIVRVDLVYTDYPAKKDFSALSKSRLEALQKQLPKIFLDKNVEFRKIRQTIATDLEYANMLSHGFYIYFRPLPSKTSGKEEVEKLKTIMDGKSMTMGDESMDTVAMATEGISWCSTAILIDTLADFMPELFEGCERKVSKLSIKEGIEKKYILKEDEDAYRSVVDSVFLIEDKCGDGCAVKDYFVYENPDSTVSKVFERRKWKNPFIVADVTGSMYPYTGQLLKWLKLNLTDKQKKYFLFFNDGDNKADSEKAIGKTGGLYPVLADKYEDVERTLINAMINGGGGDAPENNLEALLESEKICNSCDSIVMIADNWAPVKDISLLAGYKKPVKIVLCGVFDRINKDYLKLARDTKGSIHLMEEDIYILSMLKDGDTIKIRGKTYKLVGGEFEDVTPMSL